MNNRAPRQAVILTAGASTRTHPLTIAHPKPLLPLLNKPILQHTLEQLDGLVDHVILVVGFERDQIYRKFGSCFRSIKITYCVQEIPLGTGHALLQAKPHIDGSFFVLNGDDLLHHADLERLVGEDYGILGGSVDDPRPYGILDIDSKGNLNQIIEKPTSFDGSPLVNTGAYILQKDVIQWLDTMNISERGEYELVDIVKNLPGGARCFVVRVSEYWIPVGYPWDLLDANLALLKKGTVEANSLPLSHNIQPEYIGPGTIIEPECVIGPGTTIGANCSVGKHSTLVNCLVMDRVNIGPGCHLEETIIANDVTIGPSCKTVIRPVNTETVYSMVKKRMIDTGRPSLGATIGDRVHIGESCTLGPGVKIWPKSLVKAGKYVQADIFQV